MSDETTTNENPLPPMPEGRALIDAMQARRKEGVSGFPKFDVPEEAEAGGAEQSEELEAAEEAQAEDGTTAETKPGAEDDDSRGDETPDKESEGAQQASETETAGEGEQQTQESDDPEEQAAGDGDTETSAEPVKPTGIEKRLARERRRLTREHKQELQSVRDELAQIKKQLPAPETAQAAPAQQAEGTVEADPIPIVDDYRAEDDFDQAIDRWLAGDKVGHTGLTDAALTRLRTAKVAQQKAPAETAPDAVKQEADPLALTWADAFLNIEEGAGEDSELAEKFRLAIDRRDASGRFRPTGEVAIVPSVEVLEELADNPDAHIVAAKMVESPLFSHQLVRKSPEEQVKRVRRLISDHKAKARKAAGETTTKTTPAKDTPDLGDTHATPKPKAPKIEQMNGRQTIEHMLAERKTRTRNPSLHRPF